MQTEQTYLSILHIDPCTFFTPSNPYMYSLAIMNGVSHQGMEALIEFPLYTMLGGTES
jgi:hypothetical protein